MADNAAIRIDLSQLRDLATAIKRAQPEVAKEIGVELKKAGEVVAVEARAIASASSTRIPGTIKVRKSGFTITVQAGGGDAPHAAPFEHDGTPGKFRHPVFGNRENWVSQSAHPFLGPAFMSRQESLILGVIRALDVVFAKAGMR